VKVLPKKPEIVSLSPKTLDDVFADMHQVALAAGVDALSIVTALQSRVKRIAPAATLRNRPAVGCLEWLAPLWRTGHWIPEMVGLAGGEEVLAQGGKPSRTLEWQELEKKNPELLIVMPCGYNLSRAREEFLRVHEHYPWQRLRAFQNQ